MFKKALPVWAYGKEEELNSQLVLRLFSDDLSDAEIKITASSFYRLKVNNKFVSFGPARTAGNYARVDFIPLRNYAKTGRNEIIIEVAGYCCRSLSTVKQKNFVIAEIVSKDEILAYTGKDFEGYVSSRRLRKVERYSCQRHFGEVFDERDRNFFSDTYKVQLQKVDTNINYLPRVAKAPKYEVITLDTTKSTGKFAFDENKEYYNNRYSFFPDENWGKFDESEIEYFPYRFLYRQSLTKTRDNVKLPLNLKAGEYAIFDFSKINVGFIEWRLKAFSESDIIIGFSEFCHLEDFHYSNINAQNVIESVLPGGIELENSSFEPYH